MSISSLLVLGLSLFTIHLQLIFGLPSPEGTPLKPSHFRELPAWSRGPHNPISDLNVPGGSLVWDRELHIDNGKKVEVVHVETGHVVYLISQSPDDYRTTIISNGEGKELLRFTLDKTPISCLWHVYHTSSASLSYEIHPNGPATDRWFMRIWQKNLATLAYYRGRSSNTGNVYFHKARLAAFEFTNIQQVDKSRMKPGTLKGVQNVVTYEIVRRSDIPEHYFIGLWCQVKRRIDHYKL
ncbi:hypothetical protein PTTG_02919 [Puccinia triticina 1-1 BBBD Race 1]|uniref:Uncharacterized protein n=2 Tax=Puccinia triticina TaxID=208348 RepID=A0A180GCH3_PUCT1|nr:uncharacterized protein PtA15_4A791 [Puccinia triticina]OAV90385.1 hypothetical protein PTTG_02919 [Puccinia triticina 1-1 BBBD Race 1]WAQ84338.1 hypothetical protein PtA15_4A791 [Puccinia triticina]WAR55156.1 hypothetical protein PtB15_4B776 [Puccinia triticina]